MSVRLPDYAGYLAVMGEVLAESGGTPLQLRDEGLLQSAFARPENLMAYANGSEDVFAVAASLANGIARNHPIVDGNKRAAATAFLITLFLNGIRTDTTQADLAETFQSLAAGTLDEHTLADWGRRQGVEDPRFVR
ncbi:type II toxin-antitoxin system death-on-curing family toxin [Glycocaulis sp.]|uniref:type II toxin-antitoxin system death-on-curing family toxin n=1 Tax=Glycocaulis sp. TaxID=1969725 RepID=UPI003F6FC6E2